MTPLMTVEQHELAIAAAAACIVCSAPSELTLVVGGPEPCLCCRQSVEYYSCSPGFCPRCAHDPRVDVEQASIADELAKLLTNPVLRAAVRAARLKRRWLALVRRPAVRADREDR